MNRNIFAWIQNNTRTIEKHAIQFHQKTKQQRNSFWWTTRSPTDNEPYHIQAVICPSATRLAAYMSNRPKLIAFFNMCFKPTICVYTTVEHTGPMMADALFMFEEENMLWLTKTGTSIRNLAEARRKSRNESHKSRPFRTKRKKHPARS